jgi:hypothetical protein
MFFSLLPLLITKNVQIDDGKSGRSMRFDTRMRTSSGRWKPNAISDGTRIDHLPCWATIYCLGEGDSLPKKGHEYLMFYSSAASGEHRHHHSPAYLDLQVYFPPMVFDDLWRMASEERRIAFQGEIAREDLSERSHDPIHGGSTYEWSAGDTMKVVKSFSFQTVGPHEASDASPSKLAAEYQTKYGEHSQMARLCRDIIRQTEREAERRGAKMEHTCPDGWPAVIRDLDYFYSRRQNEKHLLWWHVEIIENFAEDRFNEDGAIDLMVSLLNSPWLRCDELELAVVDYMIFWETFRFSEQLKTTFSSRWLSKGAREARARLAVLAGMMHSAYFALRPSGAFSPFQVRAALLRAQDAGAAWNPAAFAMLDRAAMRNPPVWIVPR